MNVNEKTLKGLWRVSVLSRLGSTTCRSCLGTDIERPSWSRHWGSRISSRSRQKKSVGHSCRLQSTDVSWCEVV